MFLIAFFGIVAALFALWRIGRRTRYFLHLAQLEGYKSGEYAAWVAAHARSHVFRLSHGLGALLLVGSFFGFRAGYGFWTALLLLMLWAVAFASSRLYRATPVKKPIAWTARLKRQAVATALLQLLLVLGSAWIGLEVGGYAGWWPFLAGLFSADLGAPLWVLLGGLLTRPVEKGVQEGYKKQARQKLAARKELQIVGITGSYGKTSVKFIVAEILRQRFNVLATPSSYNTPMGICLVVNNQLQPEHQILVLEMGMRHRGDIEELCEIARPDVAVVTSVGVAHLETMGSIEAIAEEKGSLLKHMKRGGIAVLNGDDERVRGMEGVQAETLRVSVEGHAADLTAHDITYGPEGARFTVRTADGEEAVFKTKLLGAHNVLNVLLGAAVGRAFGLRLRQIAQAVARVEPVAHRLALRQEGGVNVIDDAFNSNPVGARNAVEILGQFTTGRRVIVTPGMVELGERHEEENLAFGRHIAGHADLAVLVGAVQTAPIRSGLAQEGFPPEQIHVAASLYEAQDFLKTYLRPGDTVLYENDLPDQYV